MKKLVLLLFCLAFGLTLSVSEFIFNSLEIHTPDAHYHPYGYIETKAKLNCSYLVTISSSCSSSNFTTENTAIRFGDAYGKQVYEARLAVPSSRTFEQCCFDIFHINGACLSPICYVDIHRYGAKDGWKLQTVKIYSKNSPTSPLTFNFNLHQPKGSWFGYNWWCHLTFLDHLDLNIRLRNGFNF